MNTWRLMMGFAAATGLVLACSSDPEKSEDDSGDGGSATTTTTGNGGATTTTTTTTTVASTTTGAVDCSQQGAQCAQCCLDEHPTGQADFQPLILCLFCDECYADCGSAPECGGPPATAGACDGTANCGACLACAQDDGTEENPEGACFSALEACNNNAECGAIIQCSNACPE